jgi:hypothetical protein
MSVRLGILKFTICVQRPGGDRRGKTVCVQTGKMKHGLWPKRKEKCIQGISINAPRNPCETSVAALYERRQA